MTTAFKAILTTILAYLLGTSVVLSSVHAKDLASHQTDLGKVPAGAVKIHTDDVSAKAMSELHNHVDKTVFKAFAKTVSDHNVMATERQTRIHKGRDQYNISESILRIMFMFRLVYATALKF